MMNSEVRDAVVSKLADFSLGDFAEELGGSAELCVFFVKNACCTINQRVGNRTKNRLGIEALLIGYCHRCKCKATTLRSQSIGHGCVNDFHDRMRLDIILIKHTVRKIVGSL